MSAPLGAAAVPPTLILAAHGSRDVRFAATAGRVACAAAQTLPGVHVELAYLDLNRPLLDDVLAGLSGEAIVVPLLFGDGFHGKIDLPEILDRAHRRNPALSAVQTPVVGQHSPVPALADRLTQAGMAPHDGVLMYAVGSSDADSDASIRARGRELSGVVGAPVETVFATRLGHDGGAVADAVSRLRSRGARRIVASPLFLSAGLLTERVERRLDQVAPGSLVAGPVADHPALIGAIARLYLASAPAHYPARPFDTHPHFVRARLRERNGAAVC